MRPLSFSNSLPRAVVSGQVGWVSTRPLFCQYSWIRRHTQQTGWQPRGHSWQSQRLMASNSLKATIPSLPSMKVSQETILITQKWKWKSSPHSAQNYWQRHPLLQPYHFKSHGYGPATTILQMPNSEDFYSQKIISLCQFQNPVY